MLVRLLPQQIANQWPIIKWYIETTDALPPIAESSPEKMNKILESLLNGQTQCWVSYEKGERKIQSILITTVLEDFCSDTKSLLIYSLVGMGNHEMEMWKEMRDSLVKYARSINCVRICAYTNVTRMIEIAEYLGGEVDCRYVSFSV